MTFVNWQTVDRPRLVGVPSSKTREESDRMDEFR